ncbi:hypothetical protein LEP1GSC121_2608 [Leptospira borgpetersenii serovar Castellonis str. 200801910]|uniref:Uncharacterized protein n=1 Tax=Leptospira borgpetersenii serovar Ballum TaxID=280505 RepID=A0A0S2ITP8_LEPBO|nr:hypothetical protein LBBP_02818 [Leptospira borgpetersenii serovar Ballum]EKQ98968.1 hypothetical protein LEP1GSC121_2608 [Leptospira borgpetersenii serovar Castellonis str. 200801910]
MIRFFCNQKIYFSSVKIQFLKRTQSYSKLLKSSTKINEQFCKEAKFSKTVVIRNCFF